MKLESNNKHRNLDGSSYGYEELGKENYEGFPSYSDTYDASSQSQEAEMIRKILNESSLSLDNAHNNTDDENLNKSHIVNVDGTEFDLDKLFDDSSLVDAHIEKESNIIDKTNDHISEQTADETAPLISNDKKEEKVQEDRNTLIIEILNLVNQIHDFNNGFSLFDLTKQFEEYNYSIEDLQRFKNEYAEMIQNNKTFREEPIIQEDKNTLIIEILKLMNEHQEIMVTLSDLVNQLSERNIDILKSCRNAYLSINHDNINKPSNEERADQMIEAMINGQLDTNGQPIMETANQDNHTKIMGFTGFPILALVSFAFSGLMLLVGAIAIILVK